MSKSKKFRFEVIPVSDRIAWNEIVSGFAHWDVYYLNEYAHALEIHGDGEPYLIYFCYEDINEKCEFCYVVMKKDISKDMKFFGVLPAGKWYDLETPYGYGGFLLHGEFSEFVRKLYENAILDFAKKNKIVCLFIRFSPVYKNYMLYAQLLHSKIEYLKDTVYIDTTNMDGIMLQMDSKNRNMVRKAIKSGITIFHDKGNYLDEFIKIYEATMDNNSASSYYYFERSYYEYLIENMRENIEFFYSVYENRIIGAAIFFFNKEFMHYHLSGIYKEYRALAPTNLLLYEAARWACRQGIRLIHLGGGIEREDNLFCFKKGFNKNGRLPFYVGRTIFDQMAYKELLSIRKSVEDDFDVNNKFMIQYRR